jgi:cell division protein FtsZ
MNEDIINFDLPRNKSSIIKVMGVGGGGSNAVNHMYRQGIRDVDFVIFNTDVQALANSPVPTRVQLGESLTEGLGAGNKPDVGRQSAIETLPTIESVLKSNTRMVFITAGMGGGTGTGAAPIIAKAAKEMGILTVAIVTIPFRFEGSQRVNQAIHGLNELKNHVDSLLVINNEKLRQMYGDLKLSEAFSKADDVLTSAAKGIAEIITLPGNVNVDFADVRTVMTNSGVAIMGSATAEGENRALEVIQEALKSPLLNNNDIKGAKNILLNITSGKNEITMDEVYEITDYVMHQVSQDVNIIWGTGNDASLGEKISVTIIATGFGTDSIPELYAINKRIEKNYTADFPVPRKIENFEIRKKSIKEDEPSTNQKSIEFDLTKTGSRVFTEQNLYKETPKSKKTTESQPEQVKAKLTNLDDSTIENLHNQPAYMRKKTNVTESKPTASEGKVSRYTLSTEDDGVKLRPDNSFLHDNVD